LISEQQREAQGRRFFEATARAFLGDGLPWNSSIWKQHFRQFAPILDFIHVLAYLPEADGEVAKSVCRLG
jgi:hypothetical protein